MLSQEQESGDDPAPRLLIERTATLADGALYDRDSTFTDGDTIDAFESALPTPNEISFESDEMMELVSPRVIHPAHGIDSLSA